jgi:MFS family permease
MEEYFGISATEYGALYSVYSIPNLILPFAGGIIYDKIGIRFGLLLFSFFVCLGQYIFMFGSGDRNGFYTMCIGRCLFGIGCEAMYVGQSVMLSKWFINFELPIAMGFISVVPVAGSFASGIFVTSIYNDKKSDPTIFASEFAETFMVGVYICFFCFLLVLIMIFLDKKAE